MRGVAEQGPREEGAIPSSEGCLKGEVDLARISHRFLLNGYKSWDENRL